jgi:hypothetical protein
VRPGILELVIPGSLALSLRAIPPVKQTRARTYDQTTLSGQMARQRLHHGYKLLWSISNPAYPCYSSDGGAKCDGGVFGNIVMHWSSQPHLFVKESLAV